MSVLHLADVAELEAIPGFQGKFIHSDRATLVYWRAEKGVDLPEHAHPHEQIVNLLEGDFDLVVSGVTHHMRAGDVFIIPPDAPHAGKALTNCRILDVFSPVRQDYKR